MYDSIVQILAKNDQDSGVRTVAISQLATSTSPRVSQTLTSIAADPERPPVERSLAARATAQVQLTTANPDNTFIYFANTTREPLESNRLQGRAFTYALLKAIRGEAGQDVMANANHLALYLSEQVKVITAGDQHPIWLTEGDPSTPLFPTTPTNSPPPVALVIGVSEYERKELNLTYASSDAAAVAQALQKKGANVVAAINASREEILDRLRDVSKKASGAPLIVYFSGHSAVSSDGTGWLAADSSLDPSTWIRFDVVKLAVNNSNAKSRWIFIDSINTGSDFDRLR